MLAAGCLAAFKFFLIGGFRLFLGDGVGFVPSPGPGGWAVDMGFDPLPGMAGSWGVRGQE